MKVQKMFLDILTIVLQTNEMAVLIERLDVFLLKGIDQDGGEGEGLYTRSSCCLCHLLFCFEMYKNVWHYIVVTSTVDSCY